MLAVCWQYDDRGRDPASESGPPLPYSQCDVAVQAAADPNVNSRNDEETSIIGRSDKGERRTVKAPVGANAARSGN